MGQSVRQSAIFGALIGIALAIADSGRGHWSLLLRIPVSIVICAAISVSMYWWLESRRDRRRGLR
jgi:hypothetical protein